MAIQNYQEIQERLLGVSLGAAAGIPKIQKEKQVPSAINALMAAIERLEDASNVLNAVIAPVDNNPSGLNAAAVATDTCHIAENIYMVANRINTIAEMLRTTEL